MGTIQSAVLSMLGSAQAAAGIGKIASQQKDIAEKTAATKTAAEETKEAVPEAASKGAKEGLTEVAEKLPTAQKFNINALANPSDLLASGPYATWRILTDDDARSMSANNYMAFQRNASEKQKTNLVYAREMMEDASKVYARAMMEDASKNKIDIGGNK